MRFSAFPVLRLVFIRGRRHSLRSLALASSKCQTHTSSRHLESGSPSGSYDLSYLVPIILTTIDSGGGIAGLALACTLGRYADPTDSIEVYLYEAGPGITTTGAGITVWTRTWQVMRMLGFEEELAKAAVEPPSEGESTDMH